MRAVRAVWRVAAMVLTAAASNGAAQPGPPSGDVVVRGEIAARVDTFLTRASLHGLSGAIVVARQGEVILRKGYGLADRERRVPIGPETPFFVGSLARQFTATAILRLAADGRLGVDDSLGRFFPDAPPDKRRITVLQLLTHTSGLPYLPSHGLFGLGTRDSVMREMLAEPLEFAPGNHYEYSTPGYILLAGIIERASGVTYEQYLRSLFERAGLTSTGFVGEHTRWSTSPIRSYSDANAEDLLADVPPLPRLVGGGSIVSTVGDLHKWYASLVAGDVLPAAQRDELFAPALHLQANLDESLSWMLIKLPTGTLRQAAGDIGGFNAELRHYVDEGLVVAFASNARVKGRGYREIVLNYVARMSRGESVPFPPAVSAVTESQLRSIPGTYSLRDSGTVVMWATGDSLMVGAVDATAIALLAGHDSTRARRAAEIDGRANRFLAALDSDSVAAASFIHASIPADARRMYLGKLRGMIGDSIGSGAAVVGTAVDSPGAARTYVRLRRGDEQEIIALVWRGDMLIGLEPAGRAAYPLRLSADGPDALASFDLFTGHLVRIELLGDRELAIQSNGVTRRATR